MLDRRELLKLSGAAALLSFMPSSLVHAGATSKGPFRFCLNTSTISGQQPGLLKYIDIAAMAGYDGIELWTNDIKDYLSKGNSLQSLAAFIQSKNIEVYNAISFTTWMVEDDTTRKAGMAALEDEMKMLSALGCRRIAAPPAGVEPGKPINIEHTARCYKDILQLGRKYNVMPLLEFWGASAHCIILARHLPLLLRQTMQMPAYCLMSIIFFAAAQALIACNLLMER